MPDLSRYTILVLALLVATGAPSAGHADVDFDWQLYSDVNLRFDDSSDDESSFQVGQVDFFASAFLSDKISVLGEVMAMVMPDGTPMVHPARLYFNYEQHDLLKLRFGRFHTPLGYYTTNFPHGGYLFQLAPTRPFLVNMDLMTEMIPAHMNGLSVSGSHDSGVHYTAVTGNGGSDLGVDRNGFKAVALRLAYAPTAVEGLEVGASGYLDKVPPIANVGEVWEHIGVGHIAYNAYPVEMIGELWYIRHRTADDSFDLLGGFAQVGRAFGRYTPYLRYEYWSRDPGDPVFDQRMAPVKFNRVNAGVRIRLHEKSVLKLDYGRDFATSANLGIVQSAFSF